MLPVFNPRNRLGIGHGSVGSDIIDNDSFLLVFLDFLVAVIFRILCVVGNGEGYDSILEVLGKGEGNLDLLAGILGVVDFEVFQHFGAFLDREGIGFVTDLADHGQRVHFNTGPLVLNFQRIVKVILIVFLAEIERVEGDGVRDLCQPVYRTVVMAHLEGRSLVILTNLLRIFL